MNRAQRRRAAKVSGSGMIETLNKTITKIDELRTAGEMAQIVESLTSLHQALEESRRILRLLAESYDSLNERVTRIEKTLEGKDG